MPATAEAREVETMLKAAGVGPYQMLRATSSFAFQTLVS